jgi:hypothetical protein
MLTALDIIIKEFLSPLDRVQAFLWGFFFLGDFYDSTNTNRKTQN